ncbi:hypothetical protein H072_3692 [Dactylellina haptotyla CBS 200.50]|uniref:NADP-dependent oxidoreductase domain-containing protein n=1 Tax=Dactylellina haptotyla (strain CBS 200.50) TaxID=1284197 RepID=S8AHI6_DACHA|nr:hypothetical protein H072_3692 [Dactylellina haptotyla CBS 200.50]
MLQAGYRGIDSAEWYENEHVCGRAIHDFLSTNPSLSRSSIFFTTKLRNNVSYDATRTAIKRSLKDCNLGYIDLYLIHAPYGGPKIREEIYRAAIDAVKDGEVKGLGVSNYGIRHLQEILDKFPDYPPLVNQIELNPFITQPAIVTFCRENNIILQAYTPLAKSQRFSDDTVTALADKYGKTPAEIMIKWGLQEGFVSLPKSVTQSRIIANLKGSEGWGMEEEDMQKLRGLDEHFVTEWDPTDCPTFTSTTTVSVVTIPLTSTATLNARKRQATGSVPDYAAYACPDTVAYSSACQCIGVPADGTAYTQLPNVTVTESITATTSAVVTQITEFALQLTGDAVNAQFKGNFLYSFLDSVTGSQQVGSTADFAQAAKFYADANGNVTGLDGVPFAVAAGNNSSNIYQQIPGSGSIYLAIHNSTAQAKLFSSVTNIYTAGCVGPIILKSVPYPTGATTAPAAAAKRVILQEDPSSGNVYSGQYLGLISESVGGSHTGTTLKRLLLSANQAAAIVFFADPINGNLFSLTNEPFIFDNSASSNFWLDFPEPGVDYSTTDVICPCILGSDLQVTCRSGDYVSLAAYSTDAHIQIYNNPGTPNSPWVGPLRLKGIWQ